MFPLRAALGCLWLASDTTYAAERFLCPIFDLKTDNCWEFALLCVFPPADFRPTFVPLCTSFSATGTAQQKLEASLFLSLDIDRRTMLPAAKSFPP